MRISIDVDGGKLRYWWSLLKGRLLIGRTPDRIYKTRKGYHLIWEGLPISAEQSMRYRKLIGDDDRRIHLDSVSNKRLKQVLFCQKDIYIYDPAKSLDEEKKLIRHETYIRRRIR
jgi:hypothetical protein